MDDEEIEFDDESEVLARYRVTCPDCGCIRLEIEYYGATMEPEFYFCCTGCGEVFELGDLPKKED